MRPVSSSGCPDVDLERRRAQIRQGLRRANTAAVIVLILVIGLSLGALFQAFRAERSAREAGRSRREAESELERERSAEARALLERARTQRRTGEAGQRSESLAAVARAATLQPSGALREEAIAALALPDLKFVPVWTNALPAFCQFSPSFGQFALPGPAGTIEVRNTGDGHEESILPSAGAELKQSWFSPDARFLAAHYVNSSNVVWNIAAKTRMLSLGPGCRFLEFCPDSERVLVVENSGALRCLSLAGGQELWHGQVGAEVTVLSVASQGPFFALALENGPTVQVRSLRTGEQVCEFVSNLLLGALGWSLDGRTLVVGRENGWLEIWDMETRARKLNWKAHDDTVVEVRFDPLGRWLASSSWDGTIRFWSLPDFRPVIAAKGYQGHFVARFSPDGGRFACVQGDRTLGFLETSSSPVLGWRFVTSSDLRGSWSLDVSPDGKLIAAGYEDGLRILDLATGRPVAFEPIQDCRSALFTPKGDGLVTCGETGLAFWPIEYSVTDTAEAIHLGPRPSVKDTNSFVFATLTSDGRWAAAANRRAGRLEVFDLNQPTNHFTLGPHPKVQFVAASPNGQWLASGTWFGRRVKVWEIATRHEVADLPLDQSAAVTFSPDSQQLVTSTREYHVWESGSWRELYRTPEIGAALPPCAFSPDGQLLALLKAPHTIELRQPATGRVLAALEAPGSPPVSTLRFTPDSKRLLALEWTRQIEVWDLARTHQELSKLGLDWDVSPHERTEPGRPTPGTETPPAVAPAPVRPNQWAAAAKAGSRSLESQTGAWFYALTLAALAAGITIGFYTLRYHRRMMLSYEKVESVAAERNRALDIAQAELLHSQKMRALGTLAAGVAHDFNNLLSIIRMGNNMLGRRHVSPAEKAECRRAVERAVEQGKQIVRSMLGYSREQSEEAGRYSVPDLVKEAGLLLNQQFLRGITVAFELDRDLPEAAGRGAKLQQVLLNLMVNAAEAMNGQGRLRISARAAASPGSSVLLRPGPAARYVELVIQDTGPGIDPRIQDRIFEPFFSTKPRGASSGTGLGLSLVHSLAEQEKLGISLDSQPGRGTTFTLWIPVAEAATGVAGVNPDPFEHSTPAEVRGL